MSATRMSYDLLSESEKAYSDGCLFSRWLFSGGGGGCGLGKTTSAGNVLHLLGELVGQSLVTSSFAGTNTR